MAKPLFWTNDLYILITEEEATNGTERGAQGDVARRGDAPEP